MAISRRIFTCGIRSAFLRRIAALLIQQASAKASKRKKQANLMLLRLDFKGSAGCMSSS
jgi:hypothetical protein